MTATQSIIVITVGLATHIDQHQVKEYTNFSQDN
jgi:hypothetical protein